jgi:hypothetical protein
MSPNSLAPAVRIFQLLIVGKCQYEVSARTPGIVKEEFYDFDKHAWYVHKTCHRGF